MLTDQVAQGMLGRTNAPSYPCSACQVYHVVPIVTMFLSLQKHGLLGKAAFIAELRAWAKVSSQ